MTYQALITANEVISIAFMDSNLATSKIKDEFIKVAQETYIRELLGDDFYEEVLENYNTSPYDDLVTQIKPALAYYVKYLALPDIITKITNKGAALSTSNTTEQVDSVGRGQVRRTALEMGDKYAEIVTRWIQHDDNKNDFPNYYKNNNVRNRVSRKCGFIFPK